MSHASDHEARRVARALHERRGLAHAIGLPDESLEAARSLARWAESVDEPTLAIAIWEGCAALDDGPRSWLGLARVCLRAGDAQRAFSAAAEVIARASATEDRDEATLHSARACLLAGRLDDARRWLATLESPSASPLAAELARTLLTHRG